MRLLKTGNLQFEEFYGSETPAYAILSHRWREPELSYQDICRIIEDGNVLHEPRTSSYDKIMNSRAQARGSGYQYIWVDTCCIDKASSAEYQEAINSMWQWYVESAVCYAYLDDVDLPKLPKAPRKFRHKVYKDLLRSEWFTRGWMLQELLAPKSLIFFDRNWNTIGNSLDLRPSILRITGIDLQHIRNSQDQGGLDLFKHRIGRRMSWASRRDTKRVEDRAYSLLGIFNVHMAMLYGERERAFARLQEEILKCNEDASILVWTYQEGDVEFAPNGLAPSATHFRSYRQLVQGCRSRRSQCNVAIVDLDFQMKPRGLLAAPKVWADPLDEHRAYIKLAEDRQGSRSQRVLVTPIMYTNLSQGQEHASDCVRYANPLWVGSDIVKSAVPMPLCFVRRAQAVRPSREFDGFSLGSLVWADFATTFTYPLQTQGHRRHFPVVLKGPAEQSRFGPTRHTFVLEMQRRTDPGCMIVVLVDYRAWKQKIARDTEVTLSFYRSRKRLDLGLAIRLAKEKRNRHHLASCQLLDDSGRRIPTDRVNSISSFSNQWLDEGDDDDGHPNLVKSYHP
ncbi:HET-domain-containing protein [Colletotrichum eremochloae]|nr:HET-domain-containing protein [Colletotrichum eremochloae]